MALAAAAIALATTAPAGAVQPDEILDDPALEARARAISAELRCLVCQNQSIDDSNAPLARDLRLLVRERLEASDSDGEVLQFIVDRYGEFVLLQPPVNSHTLLLWAAPALLLVFGIGTVFATMRRRSAIAEPDPLSEDERRRLEALIEPAERGRSGESNGAARITEV